MLIRVAPSLLDFDFWVTASDSYSSDAEQSGSSSLSSRICCSIHDFKSFNWAAAPSSCWGRWRSTSSAVFFYKLRSLDFSSDLTEALCLLTFVRFCYCRFSSASSYCFFLRASSSSWAFLSSASCLRLNLYWARFSFFSSRVIDAYESCRSESSSSIISPFARKLLNYRCTFYLNEWVSWCTDGFKDVVVVLRSLMFLPLPLCLYYLN